MKNKKLLREYFTQRSSDVPTLIALLAGMAAGAALGILFAPEGGKRLRKRICNWKGEDSAKHKDEQVLDMQVNRVQGNHKRPKSDIGSLIQQAHHGDVHTEQGLS